MDRTLNISTDTICFIINCAREFQAKEAVTFPEKIADSENEYDLLQILADHQDDMTFLDAKKAIEDLEADQQVDILALMYLGRGDFEASEWDLARREARDNLAPLLTEYLFNKPQIPYYLEKGLEMLGFSCEQ